MTEFFVAALLMTTAVQGAQGVETPPCQTASYRSMDFLIGQWRLTDPETGEVSGMLEFVPILNGCAYSRVWEQRNNRFQPPGVDHFYAAHGILAFPDGNPRQVVFDNRGDIYDTPGQFEDGILVFDAEPDVNGVIYRTQTRQDDQGRIWSEAFARRADGADWTALWRLEYVSADDE